MNQSRLEQCRERELSIDYWDICDHMKMYLICLRDHTEGNSGSGPIKLFKGRVYL